MRRVLHCIPEYIYWLLTNPNRVIELIGWFAQGLSQRHCRTLALLKQLSAVHLSKAQDGCLEQNRKKHASFAVSVLVRLTVSSTPLPARRRWACKKFERQTMTMHFDRARQWIVPGCSNFPDFAVLHDILLWPRLNELSTNPFSRNWKHKVLLFPMPSGGPCLNNDLPQHLFLTGTNSPQRSRGLNKSQWRQLAWDSSSESCPRCSSWMLIFLGRNCYLKVWEMLTW